MTILGAYLREYESKFKMWVWIVQFLTRFLSLNIEFFAGLGRYKTGILFTKSNRYWIRYFARSCWCYHLQSKQSILVATVVILALLRKTSLTAPGNKCIARECNKVRNLCVYVCAKKMAKSRYSLSTWNDSICYNECKLTCAIFSRLSWLSTTC